MQPARFVLGLSMVALFHCGDAAVVDIPDAMVAPEPTPRLVINEVMTENTWTQVAGSDDFTPWIELYNPHEKAITLNDCNIRIDSDVGGPIDSPLPATQILSGGYLVLTPDALSTWQLLAITSAIAIVCGTDVVADLSLRGIESYADASVGFLRETLSGPLLYLDLPTPGAANTLGSFPFVLQPPTFSVERSHVDQPFELELHARAAAMILFTVDGSIPTMTNATAYTQPISIASSQTIRAIAVSNPLATITTSITHTYLFLDQVIASSFMQDKIKNDPVYGPILKSALTVYPTVSLTTGSTITLDDTVPVSIEFFDPIHAEAGFQINAGARYVGNTSVRYYPKKNIRLYFQEEFGPTKLSYPIYDACCAAVGQTPTRTFDELTLRSGAHDSIFYLGGGYQPPANGQYVRNRFMQESQMRMGQPGTHGRFVQVYLNTEYIGQFDMQERPTAAFMASYFGGNKDAYAAVNGAVIGDIDVWAQVKASAASWEQAQQWIDIDNLIDYQLLQYVAGNDWDWLTKQNWLAAGPRDPTTSRAKWQFFPWDSDLTMVSPLANVTNPNGIARSGLPLDPPDGLFTALRAYPEFLVRFEQRAAVHLGPGGALSDDAMKTAYQEVSQRIELSVIAESARWGNFGGHDWTLRDDWDVERARILQQFFNGRAGLVQSQLQAEGLLP